MHNFWMNIRRYKALVLALLPFLIAGTLLLLMETTEGFRGIGYLLILIVSMPVLAALSVMAACASFNKSDPNRRWIRATKVISIASATVFVGFCVLGAYGAVTSIMGSS